MQSFAKWTKLPANKQPLEWRNFEDAGYPFVDVPIRWWRPEWHDVHNWCTKEIGKGRYMHTGERF